jgi:hypothetical protein
MNFFTYLHWSMITIKWQCCAITLIYDMLCHDATPLGSQEGGGGRGGMGWGTVVASE